MSPTMKICIVCGQDCSQRPRSKDSQGRYTCDQCAAQVKRAARGPAPAPAPAVAAFDDDGPLRLADDDVPAAMATMSVCPNCARPLASDALICIGCGFNRATGRNVGTAMTGPGPKSAPKPRSCRKCGYDMAGLKGMKCPECGTVNTPPGRRERDLEESRRLARRAWISPIIMFVVGLSITSGIIASSYGADALVVHLISFALSLVVGVVIYVMCSVMWIGFDEPMPMMVLRLAGVYALANIGYTLVGMARIPMTILTMGIWAAPMVVYILLLAKVMELDYEDAVIVALVTTIAKVVLTLVVVTKLASMM